MPKSYQNRKLPAQSRIRDTYDRINQNSDEVNADLTELYAQDASHVSSQIAHTSSAITNSSTVSGSKVTDALNAIKARIDGHVGGTAEKHSANAINFIPTGAITSTEVQAAITQLDARVSNIIAQSGTSNTETVDARISSTYGSFGTLKARTDNTDIKLKAVEDAVYTPTSSTPSTVHQPITSLPSTVIKGRADWKVEGNTLTNAVVNGDFAAGTTGWDGINGTLSASNKILTFTNTISTYSAISNNTNLSILAGQKIFLKVRVRIKDSLSNSFNLRFNGTISGSLISLVASTAITSDKWEDFYGIATITDQIGKLQVHIRASYANTATATGKVMEVDGNIGVFAIPITGTPYESFTADQMNALVTTYFEGTQGTKDVRVKSVGKNLFDINNSSNLKGFLINSSGNIVSDVLYNVSHFIKVKPSTTYVKTQNFRVLGYDKNKISLGLQSLSGNTFTTSLTSSYVRCTYLATDNIFMLNEGSAALPYENYTESETFLPVTLSTLPNNTVDSVESDGKLVKRIAEYTLTAADVTLLSTSFANTDRVAINKPTNAIFYGTTAFTTARAQQVLIPNFKAGLNEDSASQIWTVAEFTTTSLALQVPKGTYATLAAAQAALAGTKIYYQLQNPITTQLLVPNLIAEPSGTMYVDNMYSDVALYGANITVAGRTFNAIEKVVKINKDTGEETDVTSTCTLTAGKDGFTSTALVSGDLVWFALESTNTTLASLTYSYPMDIKASIEGNTKAVQQIDKQIESIDNKYDVRVSTLENSALATSVYGLRWNITDDIRTRTGANNALVNFNNVYPYSQMRRCNLSDAGVVNAYFGDPTYIEDGTNGQVMVEIPKFYSRYRSWTEGGKEFVQWDVSAIPYADFEVDPAFRKGAGFTEKIYISAFEGSIYDVSATAYLLADEQVADFTATTGDKLSSIAGVKPCSGLTQDLTLPKSRILANNRGAGWGLWNGLQVYALQKLLFIECASFNSQTAIGLGVVNKASGTGNEAEITGATSFLGNSSGRQAGTDGLTSVSYRGVENMWGNIWSWVDGINIQADNKLWINPTNQTFASDSFVAPYELQGTLWNVNGYVSNILKKNVGLFATASSGSSSTRIPDYYYQATGNRVALLGGSWVVGANAGFACFGLYSSSVSRSRDIGARLCFFN